MVRLSLLLASLVLAGSVAAAAVAAAPDRITICHKPDGATGQTKEVPRSAWSGHERHGDHQGRCTEAELKGPTPPSWRPVPLSIRAGGDGHVDGDADFVVEARNGGDATAHRIALEADLRGEGRWTLREGPCSLDAAVGRVACSVDGLGAGSSFTVRLHLEGPLVSVCREAAVAARVSADNDGSSGDDQAQERAWTGACSPLDHSRATPVA